MKKIVITTIVAVLFIMLSMLAGCSAQVYVDSSELPVNNAAASYSEPVFEQVFHPINTIGPVDIGTEGERLSNIPAESIKIGVTHSGFDDVGQILEFFGGGADFYVIGTRELQSADILGQFYAVFINCGSHDDVDADVLRDYVYNGGVVYASDLAGEPLTAAFPAIFDYEQISSLMTISRANVAHSSLASHMGTSTLDVVFNMGGWYAITALSEDATVYIEGDIPGHGPSPLAMSFDYGEGTVFYTSFHNNAQATTDMVNFIEYLVFRIKFIEADRVQTLRAERDGFVFQGQVFGFFARAGGQATGTPGLQMEFSSEEDVENLITSFSLDTAAPQMPTAQEAFRYTFAEGESFMLMVESGGESFTMRLYDPAGNMYHLNERGVLISSEMVVEDGVKPVFESFDGYGVRVRNAAGGEWSFRIIAENADSNATFAVGIATQGQ